MRRSWNRAVLEGGIVVTFTTWARGHVEARPRVGIYFSAHGIVCQIRKVLHFLRSPFGFFVAGERPSSAIVFDVTVLLLFGWVGLLRGI